MRDEIVILEDEADLAVAVGVPVAAREVLGAHAVNEKFSPVVAVEPADDVEERGLSAARGAEDRRKFALAEGERDVAQGMDGEFSAARTVVFGNVSEL